MKPVLTEYQRLSLLNQYKILQELANARNDEREAERYEQLATIVADGYVGEYCQLTEELSEEIPEEDTKFVWDTLRMYSAIYCSYKRIENPTISESDIYFDGFDGNEEIREYAFCKFILFNLNRFGEFTENNRRDFNSHCRRCPKYSAMLEKWTMMGEPYDLSENDIKALISAY